jgi:hypothetical protein
MRQQVHDISTVATLYSALIQANATILAIFTGFLTFSTLRGPLWGRLLADFQVTNREFTQRLTQLSERARAAQDPENPQQEIQFTMDEVTEQLFEKQKALGKTIEEHIITISDYKFSLRPILFLGLFGVVVPAVLLAYLPHDQAPFTRSYFAITGYAIALFGILLFVRQFGPDTDLRLSSKRPDVIKAWRVLGVSLALCLLGMDFAHLLPFPTE